MTSLAVLRPEPGNTATAGRIEAAGARAIRLPLFAVKALDWVPRFCRETRASLPQKECSRSRGWVLENELVETPKRKWKGTSWAIT